MVNPVRVFDICQLPWPQGLENTTSSAFSTWSSYGSAETRFGVRAGNKQVHADLGDREQLHDDDDRPSYESEHVGGDDRYGTDDTGLTKPKDSVGYTGSEEHGYGESALTGDRGDRSQGSDSTLGKLMENSGDVLNKEGLAEKGREKRQQAAGYDNSQSEYRIGQGP